MATQHWTEKSYVGWPWYLVGFVCIIFGMLFIMDAGTSSITVEGVTNAAESMVTGEDVPTDGAYGIASIVLGLFFCFCGKLSKRTEISDVYTTDD